MAVRVIVTSTEPPGSGNGATKLTANTCFISPYAFQTDRVTSTLSVRFNTSRLAVYSSLISELCKRGEKINVGIPLNASFAV